MKITLEIKDLKDWEILSPLLERLKIKVINKPIITERDFENENSLEKPTIKDGIMQFAGILTKEEAAIFDTAISETRQIDLNEW